MWIRGRPQQWESQSSLLAVFDTAPIPDYDFKTEIGRDLLLDDVPKREGGNVLVTESLFVWQKGLGWGSKSLRD